MKSKLKSIVENIRWTDIKTGLYFLASCLVPIVILGGILYIIYIS